MGLLDATGGGGRLTSSLGGKLLTGGLTAGGLTRSLLGTSHGGEEGERGREEGERRGEEKSSRVEGYRGWYEKCTKCYQRVGVVGLELKCEGRERRKGREMIGT